MFRNHCCAGKYDFFVTLIHLCTHVDFLCGYFFILVINFTRFTRDMYPVKTNCEKNWHVPCLAEEKETVLS